MFTSSTPLAALSTTELLADELMSRAVYLSSCVGMLVSTCAYGPDRDVFSNERMLATVTSAMVSTRISELEAQALELL